MNMMKYTVVNEQVLLAEGMMPTGDNPGWFFLLFW
jgi:hypothetical protein